MAGEIVRSRDAGAQVALPIDTVRRVTYIGILRLATDIHIRRCVCMVSGLCKYSRIPVLSFGLQACLIDRGIGTSIFRRIEIWRARQL